MEKNNKIHIISLLIILVALISILSPFGLFQNRVGFVTFEGDAVIKMRDNEFAPQNIRIKKGAKVTFINESQSRRWPASDIHPVHLIYSEFDPRHEIYPDDSWGFIFTKSGRWNYHDHLSPTFVGVIEVRDGNLKSNKKTPTKIEDCTQTELSEKQQCWNELLIHTVRRKDLDAAFALFIQLYQTDPSIPKGCHGWTHILGKEAYDLFKNKKNFILREETSYCGYGFFHGFIERLLQDTGDIKKTKEFCEYASKQLGEESGVYGNCLHGFGHGSVNIDDPSIWGNFQAMIQPGLDNCEKILSDPENVVDLRICWDGAFNAMQQNINDNLYDLKLDGTDLFSICRKQEEKYKMSCYFEFVGLISKQTEHDFGKSSAMLLKEKISEEIAKDSILKMAADFMQDDIVNLTHEKNVMDCRSLPQFLYKDCFNGILSGFIGHGEPKKQYIKGLEFCREKVLTNDERERCYEYIVSQSVPKDSDICNTLPETYRKYCLKKD